MQGRKNRYEAAVYKEPDRYVDPIICALRKRRVEKNMSVQSVADLVGYNRSTLHRAENGHMTPNFFIVKVWAEALGYKLELTER